MLDFRVHIHMDEEVMNQCELFSRDLQNLVGKRLELSITDNRSTMLSVRWEPEKTKVSLHRMFLQAPIHIRNDLVRYLKRAKTRVPITIKAFIQEKASRLDYSHLVERASLLTRGHFFDLQAIYNRLNRRYFNNKLKLSITWYGSDTPTSNSRCSLGLFYDALRLIKVHNVLDAVFVPCYVVEYIVYHEMVHAICPAYVDNRGINRVLSPEFLAREKCFTHYAEAIEWLKENRKNFFISKRHRYGRSQQMGKY